MHINLYKAFFVCLVQFLYLKKIQRMEMPQDKILQLSKFILTKHEDCKSRQRTLFQKKGTKDILPKKGTKDTLPKKGNKGHSSKKKRK